MEWYLWVLWVLAIFLSTSFMAFYVRKYHKAEGIIAVYVIYLAVSQILAVKLVNFDLALFGLKSTPLGVLVYPFTYQLTDTVNEHFGKRETLKMVGIAFITQVLLVLFLYFGTAIAPINDWYIDNTQWNLIFNQSFGITLASWLSFLVTGFLDTLLFHKVKQWTHGKYLWIRSILSDVPMLFLDSVIFVGLAFGILGDTPTEVVWIIMQGQILTKWLFGIIDTPFIYWDRWIINTPALSRFFHDQPTNPKVVLILSGGMDSTTLLYRLKAEGKEIHAISYDYSQRHSKELIAAKNSCNALNIPQKIVNLKGLIEAKIFGDNALTANVDVPEGDYTDESMKVTVVPNRNMVMLSIAISYAISIGASKVYYGAHAGDHAIYPDCRTEFVEAIDQVARICDYHQVSIHAPYLEFNKADIVAEGLKYNVDYQSTWTCYKGEERACGKCGSCKERLEAFAKNHVEDPLEYME